MRSNVRYSFTNSTRQPTINTALSPPLALLLTTTTTTRAANNCAWSRCPLPPLPSCRLRAVHRRRAIHCHRHCLRRRRHRCRRHHHRCQRHCCRCCCVTIVPSVVVALPSHCPLPSLPSTVVPSGRSGLARPANALAPPLPQSLRRAALATAALPPPLPC